MQALLVPVKAFRDAKLRLAPVMSPNERYRLARALAQHVICSAGGLEVAVVCDDHEVAAFAERLGATVLWTPGLGLSGAVQEGVRRLSEHGIDTVVVAHADLPRAAGFDELASLADGTTAVLVPDRAHDGTNVIALGSATGFRFSYGRGSFSRHIAEARFLGLDVVVREDPLLSADVDIPSDLALIAP